MKTQMKSVIAMLVLGTVGFANAAVVKGPTRIIVGQTYTATARYAAPLSTFERCEGPSPAALNLDLPAYVREYEGTIAGRSAYHIAVSEALSACKNDMNADCKIVSALYKDFVSTEFIGYKACDASITVHGYRMN